MKEEVENSRISKNATTEKSEEGINMSIVEKKLVGYFSRTCKLMNNSVLATKLEVVAG